MKRLVYLLLFAITTSGSMSYAQSKQSNAAEKRKLLEEIAEYERKLENAQKTQQANQRNIQDSEVEAILSNELKKLFAKNPQLETKINKLTRDIYAGKATAADYIDLFEQIPNWDAKVTVYNKLRNELKDQRNNQKNIYQMKEKEMHGIVSDFRQELYDETGIYPIHLDGETIAKRPVDDGALDFIDEINAERKEKGMSRLDKETVNYIKDRRNAVSMEYLKADVAKSESATTLKRLKKGLEELQKACPECANQ